MEASLGPLFRTTVTFWEAESGKESSSAHVVIKYQCVFFFIGLEIVNIMFFILCCIGNNPLHHSSASTGLKLIKEGSK